VVGGVGIRVESTFPPFLTRQIRLRAAVSPEAAALFTANFGRCAEKPMRRQVYRSNRSLPPSP
jgi:hypothetical protein